MVADPTNDANNEVSENMKHVASANELSDGERVVVDVNGLEIGVFNIHDEYYALVNFCVHQGGPICEGSLSGTIGTNEDKELVFCKEDEVVTCPWHGWGFDVKTGEHLLPTGHRLPSYDVVEVGGELYLDM